MSGYITPKSASTPATQRTPLSRVAVGALLFALSIPVANVVLNVLDGALLTADLPAAFWWIAVVVHLLVVLTLFSLALGFGVVGLRRTADGELRGRGRAIAGIVLASFMLVVTVGGAILTLAVSYTR